MINPLDDIREKIAEYEALEGIGVFPLSLRVFWEVVGSVDFTGYHPLWPRFSDPLILFPVESIDGDYPSWREGVEAGDIEAGPFEVAIAPDYFHKDNISGGAPYSMRVPNDAIDGILEYERHETTLVDYLRICFRYGGFPGLEFHKGEIPGEISGLSEGLMAI